MNLLIDAHVFDSPTMEGIAAYLKGLYFSVIQLSSDINFCFAAHNKKK